MIPFEFCSICFFIQSDILEIRTEKSFQFCSELKLVLFSGHNANSAVWSRWCLWLPPAANMCYFWSWSTLFQVTLFVMIHVIAFFKKKKHIRHLPKHVVNSLQLWKWKHLLGGFKIDFVISLNQVGHITELVSQIKCHQLIFMMRLFIKPLFCHNTNSANVLYTLFWYMYYKLFLYQT